jgi:hypothetical protein
MEKLAFFDSKCREFMQISLVFKKTLIFSAECWTTTQKIVIITLAPCSWLQLAVASICIFVILPLTLVGTVLGRNLSGTPNYPCRINAVPR